MLARVQLRDMRKLGPKWDSYDAKPIYEECINRANDLLDILPGDGWQAVPCADGSVQLEQHRNGIDIEVVVRKACTAVETSPALPRMIWDPCSKGGLWRCDLCDESYCSPPWSREGAAQDHAGKCPKMNRRVAL